MNNNKSILILDTPKECRQCDLCYYEESTDHLKAFCAAKEYFCSDKIYSNKTYREVNMYTKPSWCPLASLPLHKDLTQYIHRGCGKTMANGMMYVYDQGWNDCIDFILQNNKNT